MYSKWIKCGFILAMLLVSMVSLSMAACPWFIKNDLYTAQCGVLKDVPASAGLLANDPTATAVLDPASITIDPKYGTLDVNADGSFVYDPSPDIQSGTYVQFKYNATNGVCAAKYAGIAKIQVSCKCRPNMVTIPPICLPKTLDEIKAIIEAAGVDCLGCGDIASIIDLSKIELDEDGNPVPGTYPFLLKCYGCLDSFGSVTLTEGCTAVVEDFEVCEGTVPLELLEVAAIQEAKCVGCDAAPVLDFSGVIVENGFVAGGSYTGTCAGDTDCGGLDTGIITVFRKCEVSAPPVEICEGSTLDDLEQAVFHEEYDCTGEGCDASPVLSYENVITDENGFVIGGTYTVTCTVAPGCASSASGTITVVELCNAVAPDLTVCEGTTLADLQDMIDGVADCTGDDCDASPDVDTSGVTLVDGIVTGGSYTVTCTVGPDCESSATGTITVVPRCEVEALDFTTCVGQDTLETLAEQGYPAFCGDSCPDSTPVIDDSNVIVDENGFVTGGSYTATCSVGPDCESSATGNIVPEICEVPCTCEAVAPPIEVCSNKVTIAALIDMINEVDACDPVDDLNCDATPVIGTSGVTVSNGYVTGGTYTVTCTDNPLCEAATGNVIVVDCPCDCNAYAPDICLPIVCFYHNCKQYTYDEIKAEVIKQGGKCTGSECNKLTLELPSNIHWNYPGDYTYKVVCKNSAGTCVDKDEGTLSVKYDCGGCSHCG